MAVRNYTLNPYVFALYQELEYFLIKIIRDLFV